MGCTIVGVFGVEGSPRCDLRSALQADLDVICCSAARETTTAVNHMTRSIVRATIHRLVFYVGATAVVLLVWQVQKHVTGAYFEPLIDSLTPLQEKQLDAFLEMNRLITTLGTALLGAIGFLLVNGRKEHLRPGALWTALGSTVCVGLSLLSGYIVYLGILWMLQSKFFNLNISGILWARQAHFYTFLLGVVFFC